MNCANWTSVISSSFTRITTLPVPFASELVDVEVEDEPGRFGRNWERPNATATTMTTATTAMTMSFFTGFL
jgi:hypothetical protein